MSDITPPPASLSRRGLLKVCFATSIAPSIAIAQEYPSRPVRLIVAAPPGGASDFNARLLAQPLSELLRTPVVVENKPGASGIIATDYVAKAPADGYTLLAGTPSPVIIAPQAMPKSSVHPLKDLIAINMFSNSPLGIAVHPKLEARRLRDLVALSRKRPITMALPTAGSLSHLFTEMVASATGCRFQNVPYKGAGPANTDTIAGHVDSTVSDIGVFLPLHAEGRLRVIVVSSDKRVDVLPDVPTASEDNPGLVATNWFGVFAPANTPRAVIAKLNEAVMKSSAREEVKSQLSKSAAAAVTMEGPEQFQKFVAAEYERYGRIVREKKITLS